LYGGRIGNASGDFCWLHFLAVHRSGLAGGTGRELGSQQILKERQDMNVRFQKLVAPAILLVVLVAASAFAKNGKQVTLNQAADVNGATLVPGSYHVTWSAPGGDPTVSFMKGKLTVASAQAKWVDRGIKYQSDAVIYSNEGNGASHIIEIRFAGMAQALVFSDAS
jgi:hypothetical protein